MNAMSSVEKENKTIQLINWKHWQNKFIITVILNKKNKNSRW
jgi:hypothetical protein